MKDFVSVSSLGDHYAEHWAGRILRIGVWTSAGLMILGLFFAATVPSSVPPAITNPSLANLAAHLFSSSFDPVTLLFAGLVLLMLTPILRVATAIVGFAVEHDWRFVAVSTIVLMLLCGEIVYSILLKG